eukprot:a842925_825.p2 GENE.a842925_825~~a842925_825.p2  ORF type:complete len:175 (+),score=86.19 a842925_825:35-526(+)
MAALDAKKWRVENLKGQQIEITPNEIGESVSIFGCADTVVQVGKKVTSISIDNCTKVAVVFNGVIAAVEACNSKAIQIQLSAGAAPSFVLDKCNKVTIFVPESERRNSEMQFVTSACSEVLITVLRGADEDPIEIPIPEQFVSTFAAAPSNAMHTVPVAHLGV